MNYSSEAAEQVVRMSLNGVEVAAKISGKAAERLVQLLVAASRGNQKTRGKMRLNNMLRSGKPLSVFAVRDTELQKFCSEAKKYGVLYCVLKDRKANDGMTDIMVRSMDASKVNRIFERFNLSAIDMGAIKTEIQRDREAEKNSADTQTGALNDYLESIVQDTPEKEEPENPRIGRMTSSQSEPSSKHKETPGEDRRGFDEMRSRPSVRQELKNIRDELENPFGNTISPQIETKYQLDMEHKESSPIRRLFQRREERYE